MIRGKNINIRVIRDKDLTQFVDLLNDVQNCGEFLPMTLKSETALRKEFSEHGFVSDTLSQFLIETTDGEIVGLIWSFKSVPYYDAIEVGYQIFNDQFRGKGYTTTAMALFMNYLFETQRINRLELRIATQNIPSLRIAEKLQFALEGTNKEAAYSKGKLHDMNIYAMLRSEWEINQTQETA